MALETRPGTPAGGFVTPPTGLTAAQVDERVAAGATNTTDHETSRSVGEIVRANVFTRFNAILGSLLVVILVVGPLQDAVFGFILVANALVGVVQEVRAKHTLDRLSVVTAPRVGVVRDGRSLDCSAEEIVVDDLLEVRAGDQIVVDGQVRAASSLRVDESLLTGESEPVDKSPGDEVLSGSFVVVGHGRFQAIAVGPDAYATRLAAEARRFTLVGSELRNGINRILRVIQWVMVPTAALLLFSQLTRHTTIQDALRGSVAGIVTMVPEGLVLLTSIAFAVGVMRLAKRRVLVDELPAIEVLARVDVVCVDKTGTLTSGRLTCVDVDVLAPGWDTASVGEVVSRLLAATGDRNSTAAALTERFGGEAGDVAAAARGGPASTAPASAAPALAAVPFSSARKWSAASFEGGTSWLLGAPDVLLAREAHGELATRVDEATRAGRRVVLVSAYDGMVTEQAALDPARVGPLALLQLEDELRADAADTLAFLAGEGVAVKVISGDHPTTVGVIASRVGVPGADQPVDARDLPAEPEALAEVVETHSVFGRVSPQQKRAMVAALQSRGHVVAMTGDGVNDVLALKDADLAIAMGSGTSATRGVAQLVLLDDAFGGLPVVVAEGRRVIANVERVANLFLVKTVYATLLAILVGVARLPFPFLPRHLTLVSSLTIGIPAFVIALAPNPRRYRRGFVTRVISFAIPAGALCAAGTFIAFDLARSQGHATLDAARTTATLVLFVIALWLLAVLARPATAGRTWLVASMVAGFVVVLVAPPLRHFFGLQVPRELVWLAGVGIAALCGGAIEVAWRLATWVRGSFVVRRQARSTRSSAT